MRDVNRLNLDRVRADRHVPNVIVALGLALAACAGGCATTGQAPGRDHVGEGIRSRTGVTIRPEAGAWSVPAGVSLDDGMTADEAVAAALWNSPAFEASLTDLGLARADLVEAGLLRNPVLSLLFPVGPKQYEWTLQLPLEVLWQRPRRVAAARLNAQAVAERLVSTGLTLIADVRQAYVDAVAAERRVALAVENGNVAGRVAEIADARLKAGDISELEARAARSDAAQVRATMRALEHERDIAKVQLMSRVGLDKPPEEIRLAASDADPVAACGTPDALIKDALASRPDVRAAELGIEAAGQRARWERSKVFSLIATLDANGQGREGFEMGPGVIADLPFFSRNQGGVARAQADLERASRTYLAVRMQIAGEVRIAAIRLNQAQQALQIWEKEIVPELEIEQRQANTAYEAGEIALISVLDTTRRLVAARLRELEAGVDVQRAVVALHRTIGRACPGT